MPTALPSGDILPIGELVPRLLLRSLSENDEFLVADRPRGWFSDKGVDERPRDGATSGGESKDELLDDVGSWSIKCDEATRGTATAGEAGGIVAFEGVENSPGEGVLDFDLERDLDLSLPSCKAPFTPLITT